MVFDLQGIAFAVDGWLNAIPSSPPPRSLSRQNLLAEERERKRGHNEQLHAEARVTKGWPVRNVFTKFWEDGSIDDPVQTEMSKLLLG